jgi:hypothetical protein
MSGQLRVGRWWRWLLVCVPVVAIVVVVTFRGSPRPSPARSHRSIWTEHSVGVPQNDLLFSVTCPATGACVGAPGSGSPPPAGGRK